MYIKNLFPVTTIPTEEAAARAGPPKRPNRRRFKVTVVNGAGDEALVTIDVRVDRPPNCYTGPAILKARRVIPDEKPWTVGPWVEGAG